jgi:hypothetical protein
MAPWVFWQVNPRAFGAAPFFKGEFLYFPFPRKSLIDE